MIGEWRTRHLSRRYLLMFGLLLAVLTFAATASGNLTGSGFDAGDGNLIVNDEAKDWANVGVDCVDDASPAGDERKGCAIDKPTGSGDDSFGEGTAENDDPPSVVDGSIPNNKSDLTRFYVANEKAAGKDFLYLAWERVQEPSGTTNMDFEFNQSSTISTNTVTPVRTLGDLLIKYDLSQGGTNPTLGFHRWQTQAGNPTATTSTARAAICEAGNKFPCWGKLNQGTLVFEASINTSIVEDPIAPGGPNLPRSLSVRTFGEAAINLTDSNLFPAGQCVNFGSGYLKSRSSDSFTAAIKDFIAPINVNVSNCGSIELKKALVPSTDAGRFNLFIKKGVNGADGAVDTEPNVGDGGTTGANTVFAGTFNVSETAGTGTSLTNYTSSAACVDGSGSVNVTASGDVNVAADQNVVCTITNTRKTGKIELLKDFVGTAESVTLKIGTAQGGTQVDSQVLSEDGTTGENTVPTGNYFVSETLTTPANYTTSLACFNDVNDDDAVDANDTAHTVNTGTGEVAVAQNDDVLCRFTNTRKTGKIELLKRFVGAPESVTIKIGTSAGGTQVDSDTLSGDGTSGENTVDTGNYFVSETLTTPTAYDSVLACFNDTNDDDAITAVDSAHAVDTGTGQVAVGANEDVICRFTNNRKPTLTVRKVCVPTEDTGLFKLQIDSVTRAGDQNGDTACGGTTGTIVLGTGSHTVSELAGANTNLANYTSVINGDCTAAGVVSLAYGDNKTCTITNTKRVFTVVVLVCEGNSLYSSSVLLDNQGQPASESLKSSASPTATTLCGLTGARYTGQSSGDHTARINIPVPNALP